MTSDIRNVFAAYAHYVDNQKIDEWLSGLRSVRACQPQIGAPY